MRSVARAVIVAAAITSATAATQLAPATSHACGGCFSLPPPSPERAQVVTDHRMVLSLASTQTTLWDQFRYAGSPEDFVWVLPIADASAIRVGVGDNGFVDALDAYSAPTVVANAQLCPRFGGGGAPTMGAGGRTSNPGGGGGCGGGFSSGGGFTYTEGGDAGTMQARESTLLGRMGAASVGPYAVDVVDGSSGAPLDAWLAARGFMVPPPTREAIRFYVDRRFDFLVVRLRPGADVQQMQPIRVTVRGYAPTLPLRMIAAGVGDKVGLTLLVLAPSRVMAVGFANFEVDPQDVVFDFRAMRSNYAAAFRATLERTRGLAWITESAVNITESGMYYGSGATEDWPLDDAGAPDADPLGDGEQGIDAGSGEDPGGTPFDAGMDPGAADAGPQPPPRFLDRTIAFGPLRGYGVLTRMRTELAALDLSRDLTVSASPFGPLAATIVAGRSVNVPPCPAPDAGAGASSGGAVGGAAVGRRAGCYCATGTDGPASALGDALPIALAVLLPLARRARRARDRRRRAS